MKKISFILIVLVAISCSTVPKPATSGDPLPSWNDGTNKQTIINFVKEVTTAGDKFVPIEKRIAVFDNDGTLWCEQPLYFEMIYSVDMTKAIASQSKELQKKPELKALANGDMKTFMKGGEKSILEAFAISHSAVKPEVFDKMAQTWLDTAIHPRFKKKYSELTYKPMVELLKYLRDNGFKTFIVSGGSSQFIRNFSEKVYGIPAEQVIGTMLKAKYDEPTHSIAVTTDLWHNDDKEGKPVGIFQIIGRKPILAFGNSDGDQQMLQWTSTNTLPNLSLILHHTDAEREYAYDRPSKIGQLDKAMTEAKEKGWILVDMKQDFKTIFAFE